MLKHRGVLGGESHLLTGGWGSEGRWRRVKVGMLMAGEGCSHLASRGEIRKPLSLKDVSDTAFGGGHVSASTLGIQGERVGALA